MKFGNCSANAFDIKEMVWDDSVDKARMFRGDNDVLSF